MAIVPMDPRAATVYNQDATQSSRIGSAEPLGTKENGMIQLAVRRFVLQLNNLTHTAWARAFRPTIRTRFDRAVWAAFFVLASALAGCGPATPPGKSSGSSAEPTIAPKKDSTNPRTASDAGAQNVAPVEYWDVCYVQDAKIGFLYAKFQEVEEEDRTLIRGEMRQTMSLERFGQKIDQELWLTSWETTSGELVRFESRVTAGRELTISRGQVAGSELTISTTTPGKLETATIAWKPTWGGFFAGEILLRNKPLKPGERRTIHSLVPMLNQVVESRFEAEGFEALRLGGVSKQLLRIKKTDLLGPAKIETTLWMDAHGDVQKQFMRIPAPGMTIVRGTRDEALAASKAATFDLGAATVVPVSVAGKKLETAKRAVFRATLTDGPIAQLFATGLSQQVTVRDEHSAEVVVRSVRPTEPATLEKPEPAPTPADSASNGLVQCDAPSVVKLARAIAPNESEPWPLALALEQQVKALIKSKNFTQAFASAAEVAETLEGDCTEHAVLLAALCRARQIPARVVIGLVYVPALQGFAYHMWNEVWIRDRWIPLDGTLGQQGIGATHLKLVTSNLDGFDAYSAFLPVFQVLGRLKLEVVDVE